MRVSVVLAAALLAGCVEGANTGLPTPGDHGASAVAFSVLDQGAHSEHKDALKEAFEDDAAWSAFWSEHAPSRPKPTVDFDRDVVAAIVLGERPNSCYSVRVDNVTRDLDAGFDVVHFTETRPGTAESCASVVVDPYAVVVFERRWGVAFDGRVEESVSASPRGPTGL